MNPSSSAVLSRSRRRVAVGVALLALFVLAPNAGVSAQVPTDPRVVYTGSRDGVHTEVVATDQDGTNAVTVSADAEPFATINGGLVAFTRHHRRVVFASDVIIKDSITAERIFKVDDARWPLLFDGGTKLLFFPDNNGRDVPEDRDAFVSSVWVRDLVTGQDVRLAQFEGGDHYPLQTAVSPSGEQAAFAFGNDTFLFEWDIFVANTDGSSLTQITTDDRSLYPSFSPDDQTIAFMHHRPSRPCSGSVHLIGVDGSNARRLTAGTCEAILLRPVWLNDTTIVAWRWERTPRGFNRPAGLVTISTETGAIVEEIATGTVIDFAVAREAQDVVYRLRNGRIVVIDMVSGERSTVPGGRELPFGHVHIDGSLELAI